MFTHKHNTFTRNSKRNLFIFIHSQPIINSKNLTKEIGDLAYDWKSKISNTGMLRFCSKIAQENHTTEKTRNVIENESNFEGEGRNVNEDSLENGTNLVQGGKEGEHGDCEDSQVIRNPICELTTNTPPSSGKKRILNSSLVSSKRKRLSAGVKGKSATPANQRTISDFFKK